VARSSDPRFSRADGVLVSRFLGLETGAAPRRCSAAAACPLGARLAALRLSTPAFSRRAVVDRSSSSSWRVQSLRGANRQQPACASLTALREPIITARHPLFSRCSSPLLTAVSRETSIIGRSADTCHLPAKQVGVAPKQAAGVSRASAETSSYVPELGDFVGQVPNCPTWPLDRKGPGPIARLFDRDAGPGHAHSSAARFFLFMLKGAPWSVR